MRVMKSLFVLVLIAVVPFRLLHAQPGKRDSLLQVFNSTKPDTTRFKACYQVARSFASENPDSAYAWFKKGFKLNEELLAKNNNKEVQRSALLIKASYLGAMGNILNTQGKYEEALKLYEQTIAVNQKTGNTKAMATVYSNIGMLYSEQGQFSKALDYLFKSLKLSEQVSHQKLSGACLLNIGNVYENGFNDHDNAEKYFLRSVERMRAEGDLEGVAYVLGNIGLIARQKKDTAKAMNYFREALKLREQVNDKIGLTYSYSNFGTEYLDRKNFNEATAYFKKALDLSTELGHARGVADATSKLGEIAFLKKDYGAAEKYCLKALSIAQERGFPNVIAETAGRLKNIYKTRGDMKRAFEMFTLYVQTNDSMVNENSRREVTRKELQFEFEKKTTADSVKNAEQKKVREAQIQEQKAKLQQEKALFWYMSAGLVFLLAGLIVVINRFRITSRQKKIIEAQKKQVDEAFGMLAEKNKEVMDSIHYARRIQQALITSEKYISRTLSALRKK
jgi:tetratricopeptide (TPR) repeat protein